MRSTVHLASIDDALAFRPVVQPVLDWELFRNKTWSVGLEGVDLEPVLDLGRRLMEERPRSLAELRVAMAERFPDRDATTLAYACRGRLATLQVPPRGLWATSGQVRLTTLDHWSGRPLGTETAPDAMILRYLAAFGPASTSDVADVVEAHGSQGADGAAPAASPGLPRRARPRAVRPPGRTDRRSRPPRAGPLLPELRQPVPVPRGPVARRARGHAVGADPHAGHVLGVRGRRVRGRVLDGEGSAGRAVDHARADATADRGRSGGRSRTRRSPCCDSWRTAASPVRIRSAGPPDRSRQQRLGCAAGWASS